MVFSGASGEVLKEAEMGIPVAGLLSKVGIWEQTFYRWETPYRGRRPTKCGGAIKLQEENTRLKRVVAELNLDQVMLLDVLAKKFFRPRASARWSRIFNRVFRLVNRKAASPKIPVGQVSFEAILRV